MQKLLKLAIQSLIFLSLLTGVATCAGAQDSSQPAADNTKINAQDKDNAQPTADQQQRDRSDRDITREIRKSIVKDKALSTYAHNIKIISQNGTVTLRGPVRSEDEKRAVEAHAAAIVGESKVTDDLEVAPKK